MPISENTLFYYITQLRRIEKSRSENTEKNIRRIYKALLKDLNGFLGNEYAMHSQDGSLTVAILQEKLRYAKFLEEVENHINNLTPKVAYEIRKTVEETYSACYSGMVKAVKESYDTKPVLEYLRELTVQPEVMKRAIENPVSGLTLPDILEKNRKDVVYDIKQQVNISLMNGDRYETTAKKVAERLDISYGKATNIVRTETHRVQESGLMDGAKDIATAIDESEFIYTATWRTMKDERVRPQQRRHAKSGWKTSIRGKANHMKMDGVTIKVGDKFKLEPNVYAECPGMSGTARNDCRCRCYLDYDLMTEEEFNALENKQVNGFDSENDVNFVDKQGESGIINIKRDSMGLSIEIDGFTPCLVDKKTGKIVDTKYSIAKKSELNGLKKNGWNFNWLDDDLKDSTVYKLTLENDNSIQGLIAVTDFPRDNALYVNIAESAPHNIGKDKKYEGVGGHLFAIAAKESFDKGYGGFLFLDAKNAELVKYYHDKFGATLLGMPHPYRMFIDEEKAQALLKIYTLKGE